MENDNIDIRNRELIKSIKETDDINKINELFVELVSLNQGLITSVVSLFNSTNVGNDELMQEGYLSFFEAINHFNLDSDTKFSTYAYRSMKTAINRYVNKVKTTITIPEHITKTLNDIQDAERRLKAELKRNPSNKEVASILKITEEELTNFRNYAIHILDYNESNKDGTNTLLADIVDQSSKTPEDQLIDEEIKEEIDEYFDLLSDQEKDMINRSFGLNGFVKQTNKEIGKLYHITGEAVRQRVQVALNKMRKAMNGE